MILVKFNFPVFIECIQKIQSFPAFYTFKLSNKQTGKGISFNFLSFPITITTNYHYLTQLQTIVRKCVDANRRLWYIVADISKVRNAHTRHTKEWNKEKRRGKAICLYAWKDSIFCMYCVSLRCMCSMV